MTGSGRIKVLHVLEALEGGTARHVVDIVRNVAGVDHVVAIPSRRVGVPTDAAAAGHLRDAGARIIVVEMHRTPIRLRNALALGRLLRLIRREQPSLVHAHSSIGGVLGRCAAAIMRVPRVYTPNAIALGGLALGVERRLGRFTDCMVAVSTSERDQMLSTGVITPDRVTVIPNGIELNPPRVEAPDLRRLLGLPPDTPLVGTIARLNHQKAPERFVGIIALLLERDPDVHAVYIGDGPLREEFERRVAAVPLKRRFHHVPELPNAWAALEQLAVFVLTSRFEGGPYTPLEAMRAGVPVVLTDVVGNRDAVQAGRTGYLVAEDDDAASADAIIALLTDPAHRREIGEAGRRWVRSNFDIAMTSSALQHLYERIAAGHRPENEGNRTVGPRFRTRG